MAKLRFQIAATNYVLKDSTADSLNFLVGANRDKFEIEWTAGVPAGFPYGLASGDLVLVDIGDAGYDLDGGGVALREFFVTNPDLRVATEGIELSWFPLRRLTLTNIAPAGVPIYPFYVNEPAFTEFFPTLSTYEIEYEIEQDEIFFRKSFGGTFEVAKKADFDFLKNLKDTGFKYRIFVKIQRLCANVWQDEIEGFFTVAQIDFDFDKCRATFPIFTTDKYERILNNESFEINVLDIGTKYTAQFNGQTYPNGLKLGDVLAFLLTKYAPQISEVKSVFFDINNPADFVYNININLQLIENILLFAPSDVRFPTAATPASILKMTLTQLLEALRMLFNVFWFIDDGVFRLEHFEYFLQTGTDLTGKTKILKNIQKTDITNLPIAQRFKVKENLNLPYGRGFLINWDDELKHLDGGGNVEERRSDSVTTDIVWYKALFDGIITTPEPEITSGFVIYNPENTAIANPPDFDQNTAGLLSWDILLQNFYIFDVVGDTYVARTASTGGTDFENEVYQILTDIQHRRERTLVEGVLFENCCDAFSPEFLVTTTEFGAVRIAQRAAHNLRADTIETNLKF